MTASARESTRAGTGRPTPPAVRQASNSAATCPLEAPRPATAGTTCRWSPARAKRRAAEPWRTTASHPPARALMATRPASRPRPIAAGAPSTSPHAAPQVPLVRQALSTRAPPGGGAIAPTSPAPARATTAWADVPLGPSQVRTAPAPARHDACPAPEVGRRRRTGVARPRSPAASSCTCATAAGTGTSPGSGGPMSRPDRAPDQLPSNPSEPKTDRRPATASTSAAASAIPVSQLTLPGALSSTIACASRWRAGGLSGIWWLAEAKPSGWRSTGRSTVSATFTAQDGRAAAPVTP